MKQKAVSNLTPLSGLEIEKHFAGFVNGYCHGQGEFFYENGHYVLIGGFEPVSGIFRSRGNAICVSYDGGKTNSCRNVFIDAEGQVYLQATPQGMAEAAVLTKIPVR